MVRRLLRRRRRGVAVVVLVVVLIGACVAFVAIATALQESRLHNLDHGDQDSLGLFQQRPSQGWGSPGEVMTPYYAAGVFFERLAGVEGWESLPVTAAAQHVQRSAAPEDFGKWDDVPVPDARGWTVASWLVGHSAQFGITSPEAVVRVSQEAA